MTTKHWTVQVTLDETGDDTHADAILNMDGDQQLKGYGGSHRNPQDESEPRIGDELATARALSDLAHRLLDVAAQDIESRTHQKVRSLAL